MTSFTLISMTVPKPPCPKTLPNVSSWISKRGKTHSSFSKSLDLSNDRLVFSRAWSILMEYSASIRGEVIIEYLSSIAPLGLLLLRWSFCTMVRGDTNPVAVLWADGRVCALGEEQISSTALLLSLDVGQAAAPSAVVSLSSAVSGAVAEEVNGDIICKRTQMVMLNWK